MSDYRRVKLRYSEVFDRLTYRHKTVLNEMADYLKEKKLNRLAQLQILADIADMAVEYQNRGLPIDALFGDCRNAFCDRISENAPLASPAEKLLAAVRHFSTAAMLLFIILTIEISAARGYQSHEDFAWGFLLLAVFFAVVFISALLVEIHTVNKNYSLTGFCKLHDVDRKDQPYHKQ